MFLLKESETVFLHMYCTIKFVYVMLPSIVAGTAFCWYLENDLSYWQDEFSQAVETPSNISAPEHCSFKAVLFLCILFSRGCRYFTFRYVKSYVMEWYVVYYQWNDYNSKEFTDLMSLSNYQYGKYSLKVSWSLGYVTCNSKYSSSI